MIELKLYLYDSTKEDNGYRGTDLSRYVLMGTQNTEDITQVVDITEITLAGYPTGVAFAPETMFVLDETENDEIFRTFHRVVKDDYVSQPILSRDDYFDHSITLTEPSIIAQKRIVDNMSITYKLKNVKLNTQPSPDILTAESGFNNAHSSGKPSGTAGFTYQQQYTGLYAFKKFFFSGQPELTNADKTYKNKLRYSDITNFSPNETGIGTAKFTLPILYVTALLDGFSDQYETLPVSLEYRIIETDVSTGKEINTYSGLILSNSDLSNIGGAKNKEWLPEDGKESGDFNTPEPLHYRG